METDRRVKIVTPPQDPRHQRDAGKKFVIREASALTADRWLNDVVIALKGRGAELSQQAFVLGPVGLLGAFLNAMLAADVDSKTVQPLLDELLGCVQIVRDPSHPDVATALIDGDISEVKTIWWLRSEVLSLHANFSLADALWTWISAAPKPNS